MAGCSSLHLSFRGYCSSFSSSSHLASYRHVHGHVTLAAPPMISCIPTARRPERCTGQPELAGRLPELAVLVEAASSLAVAARAHDGMLPWHAGQHTWLPKYGARDAQQHGNIYMVLYPAFGQISFRIRQRPHAEHGVRDSACHLCGRDLVLCPGMRCIIRVVEHANALLEQAQQNVALDDTFQREGLICSTDHS